MLVTSVKCIPIAYCLKHRKYTKKVQYSDNYVIESTNECYFLILGGENLTKKKVAIMFFLLLYVIPFQVQAADTDQEQYVSTDTLVYEVFDIQIVKPNNVEVLNRQEGISMLSLITCYPERSNEYRLVVQAKQVEYKQHE